MITRPSRANVLPFTRARPLRAGGATQRVAPVRGGSAGGPANGRASGATESWAAGPCAIPLIPLERRRNRQDKVELSEMLPIESLHAQSRQIFATPVEMCSPHAEEEQLRRRQATFVC